MSLPIGHYLLAKGVLTEKQCAHVLEEQRHSGRPFGVIAEEMFGVDARAVDDAWADQYEAITEHIDPIKEVIDPAVLWTLSRRQAWQFRIIPLARAGDTVTFCTSRAHLVKAVNFAARRIPGPCYFVLTDPHRLAEALEKYYPLHGMSATDAAIQDRPRSAVA